MPAPRGIPVGLNIWSRLVEDTFPYYDQTVAPFDSLWLPDHVQYGANKVAEGWTLLTWALVRFGLARLVVLYGHRRFGVTVLVGFLLNLLLLRVLRVMPAEPLDLRAIGFIIPGLIANQALAQGVWPTLVLTALAAAIVRLVLVVAGGWL